MKKYLPHDTRIVKDEKVTLHSIHALGYDGFEEHRGYRVTWKERTKEFVGFPTDADIRAFIEEKV